MNDRRHILKLVIHAIPWLVLLMMPLIFLPASIRIGSPKISSYYVLILILGAVFYTNFLFLIPAFLYPRRMVHYVLSVLVLLVLVFVVSSIVQYQTFSMDDSFPSAPWQRNGRQMPRAAPVLASVLAIGTGIVIRITGKWMNQERKTEQTELARTQAELAFLKNQVNPHFFFNVLNTIYSLTHRDPQKARVVTHKLSSLMRYILYEEGKRQWTSVQNEVGFIVDYLDIMSARLSSNVTLLYIDSIEDRNLLVPPMLFTPFIENAFKHGLSSTEPCTIHIEFSTNGHKIELLVRNGKFRHADSKAKIQGGVGLDNVHRRLELIYPSDTYSLEIRDEKDLYEVILKIPCYENEMLYRR